MSLRFTEGEYQKYLQRQGVSQMERNVISAEMQSLIEKANSKAPAPLEADEQAAFVAWLRMNNITHHATPNGEYRHKVTAKKLAGQGVMAGVPDICIWPEDTDKPVLWIEMKRRKGSRTSPEQQAWIDFINRFDAFRAGVCHGCSEAIAFVQQAWGWV